MLLEEIIHYIQLNIQPRSEGNQAKIEVKIRVFRLCLSCGRACTKDPEFCCPVCAREYLAY